MTKYQIDTAIFLIGANDWQLQLRDAKKVESIFYYLFNIEDTLLYQVTKKIRDNLSFFKNPMSAPGSELTTNKAIVNLQKSLPKKKRKYLIKKVSADFNYHVNKIINICNKKKIKCVFLTQPNIYFNELDNRYDDLLKSNYLDNKDMVKLIGIYNNFLLSKKQKNIFVFDLEKKIDKSLLFFRDDYHFTKLGTDKVSEEVFQFFKNNVLIN